MDFKKKAKTPQIPWTREQEELLAEWADIATCYRWLHSRCEKLYRVRNYTFTIPVIILSTLTGTANFAMDSFVPEENKQIAMAAVGSVNIFAGILSTLQNFLRYAELLESHRLSELQWSKFGRNISVELALEPKRRKPAYDFLKICRAEYDRLIEQSPTIDDSIILQFKKAFKDNTDIKKPDICNGLTRCKIYVPTKEEKVADIVASASNKLNMKTWKRPEHKHHKAHTEHVHKEHKHRELSDLVSLGKVSEFSKAISNASPMDNVVDEINEIQVLINKNEENDVEEGSGSGDVDEGSGSGDVEEGSGSGDVDEGSGSGDVDEGSGSGDVDEGSGSGDVDEGSASGDVEEGNGDEVQGFLDGIEDENPNPNSN